MPLIQLRIHASGRSVTELKLLYTPDTAWKGPKKREPLAPRIPAQTYERSYSALRSCTLSCESRAPISRGRPQGGERVGAETIDRPPGRRSGDRRPAPPSIEGRCGAGFASSPVPIFGVRRPGPRLRPGRPQSKRTETERLTGPDSGLQTRYHHVREPHWHLVHFRSCDCPVLPDSPTSVLSTSVVAAVL